jgi:hypothetical protein
MKTTIVVPIYKKVLSDDETISLKQCFKILHRYPITFVTHRELDTAAYMQLADNTNVSPKFEYFDKEFFFTVNSYSRLLLSRNFYSRFATEDYIFIYQLDGFVFKDELEDWCKKGFDYVGAPWLIHYGRGKYAKSNQLWKVGNGGVSLRKVSAFLERFDKNMPLTVIPFYLRNIRKKKIVPMIVKMLKLIFVTASPLPPR